MFCARNGDAKGLQKPFRCASGRGSANPRATAPPEVLTVVILSPPSSSRRESAPPVARLCILFALSWSLLLLAWPPPDLDVFLGWSTHLGTLMIDYLFYEWTRRNRTPVAPPTSLPYPSTNYTLVETTSI
ncbi:uncharacterized protein KD926_003880 [Aspergillus affinis]|uniref:uncharacterized protein n=1 Tax=Aspergillus affinis TaxID=1070780 RepID=UPI0022FE109D|nr:uncharacterized protein KD926_003880 [Aspergillus affinis]KAI9043350.1 hypothetical protein KD926_003880 [Aspergillus affinis]